GLSFSVQEGIAIPPSLRNIYKEIALDFNSVLMPTHGNLETWAKQGVL
ncbi:MAG TPA: uracil-DNA glycosylase, partial [Flavobacterium sp.]|nr:uracil-DNA glycosylase [Flavobacterium sp.]